MNVFYLPIYPKALVIVRNGRQIFPCSRNEIIKRPSSKSKVFQMSLQNPIELAKQGEPNAISTLINRNLQPKGITAKVIRKDDCLRVMLEANEVPNQNSLVGFIQNGILKLGVTGITTVEVFGRQVGDDVPAWSQSISLKAKELVTPQQDQSHPRSNRTHNQSSTPAKIFTPTFGEKLKQSGLLLAVAFVLLIIPVIGWIISAFLFMIAVGALLQGQEYQGDCPYCSTKVSVRLGATGVDCSGCKKRILIKDERFYKVES